MLTTPSHVKRRVSRLEYIIKKSKIGSYKSAGCAALRAIEALSVASSPIFCYLAAMNYSHYLFKDEHETLGIFALSLAALCIFYTPQYKKAVNYFQSLVLNEVNDVKFYNNKLKKYKSQLERFKELE